MSCREEAKSTENPEREELHQQTINKYINTYFNVFICLFPSVTSLRMVHRLIRNLFIFLLHNFIVLLLLVNQDTHEKYHDLRNV